MKFLIVLSTISTVALIAGCVLFPPAVPKQQPPIMPGQSVEEKVVNTPRVTYHPHKSIVLSGKEINLGMTFDTVKALAGAPFAINLPSPGTPVPLRIGQQSWTYPDQLGPNAKPVFIIFTQGIVTNIYTVTIRDI